MIKIANSVSIQWNDSQQYKRRNHWCNMIDSNRDNIKWNKPDSKEYIPYIPFIQNLKTEKEIYDARSENRALLGIDDIDEEGIWRRSGGLGGRALIMVCVLIWMVVTWNIHLEINWEIYLTFMDLIVGLLYFIFKKLIWNLMYQSSWHSNTMINLKITKHGTPWYLVPAS